MFQPTSEPLQQTFVVMSPDSEKKTHTKILKVSHDMVFFFKYVKNNVVVSHFCKCFYKIYIQKNLLIMKLKKNYLTIRISITLWKNSKNFNDFYKLERLISKFLLLNQIISILITVYGMYFYSFLPSIICFYKYTFFIHLKCQLYIFFYNFSFNFFLIISDHFIFLFITRLHFFSQYFHPL